MTILSEIIRLALAITIAFIAGRLISRLKLPAILGWLITGIIIGPHALGLLNDGLLGSDWFNSAESLLECLFGIMIGSEMIWKQMKRSGPQIIVTTITELHQPLKRLNHEFISKEIKRSKLRSDVTQDQIMRYLEVIDRFLLDIVRSYSTEISDIDGLFQSTEEVLDLILYGILS